MDEEVIAFEFHRDNIHKAENILYPLISGFGILANVFVVSVIFVTERSRSNRTVANTFVMNLAIADILFLIALPFYIPAIHEHGYPFSVVSCKILDAMKHISYHSSILFLTGMSVDRYMAIVHSLRSLQYRTQRNARIACSVLWIASIATSVPILVFSKLEGVTSENGTLVASSARCVQAFPGVEEKHFSTEKELTDYINSVMGDYSGLDYSASGGYEDFNYDMFDNITAQHSTGEHEKLCVERGHIANKDKPSFIIWQYFTLVAFFVIPITIILFCYFKIWQATAIRKVRSQKAEGNKDRQSLQPNQNSSKQKMNWKQIQSKVTIMVAVLVSAFILSWLPFQIWIILTLPPGVKVSASHHCDITNVAVTMLAWSNSLVNPILYSITSENFRKRAKTTLFFLRYGYRSAMQKQEITRQTMLNARMSGIASSLDSLHSKSISRTIRMSVTRTSRTGLKTEKTDVLLHSMPHGMSPKNDTQISTQQSPPPTPIADGPPAAQF